MRNADRFVSNGTSCWTVRGDIRSELDCPALVLFCRECWIVLNDKTVHVDFHPGQSGHFSEMAIWRLCPLHPLKGAALCFLLFTIVRTFNSVKRFYFY